MTIIPINGSSFEISLLNFIHLVFSDNGKINNNNLIKYMDMNNINPLKKIIYNYLYK